MESNKIRKTDINKNRKSRLQAVIFDLDGVIVKTDHYHFEAWNKLCLENNWKFNRQLNEKLRGVSRGDSLDIILQSNNVSFSKEEKTKLLNVKNRYYIDFLEHIDESCVVPGSLELIKSLKDRNIKIALCSSSCNAIKILETLNLLDYFDVIITGNDIEKSKPNPEIFLKASEKLFVHPFNCIVFEDAEAGIEAAKNAGMRSVFIHPEICSNDAFENIMSFDEISVESLIEFGAIKSINTSDTWKIKEGKIELNKQSYYESIFALSNGYMGLRGAIEEEFFGNDVTYPGFFLNGVCDYEDYSYAVKFKGLADRRHVILNLLDWKIFNLYIDGEKLTYENCKVLEHQRYLDIYNGVLERKTIIETQFGKRLEISTQRIVSMVQRHIAAIRYRIKALNFSDNLIIESKISFYPKSKVIEGRKIDLLNKEIKDGHIKIESRTKTDNVFIASYFSHFINGGNQIEKVDTENNLDFCCLKYKIFLEESTSFKIDKFACFYTSLDLKEIHDIRNRTEDNLKKIFDEGFDELLNSQKNYWSNYWAQFDIRIDGNEEDQIALRFNLFNLMQSCPDSNYQSISANGQTGDHYWGGIFWDTELFVLPYFLYTDIKQAKLLLMYRYNILDQARNLAKKFSYDGALYSGFSITGEDNICVPEGPSTEYHFSIAIVYALWKYVQLSGDKDFLYNQGAEIAFEIARCFYSIGNFVPTRENKFCINAVTGPDEYHIGVNNNCYTNYMAQWLFDFAVNTYNNMLANRSDLLKSLSEKIQLVSSEIENWSDASKNMYLPFDSNLMINPQDDTYLYLDPVDMGEIPLFKDIQMDYPPANLKRMQLSKQADVVLLMFILGNKFDLKLKKANYDYYEPKTCHASSLSLGIYSIAANEVGYENDAYHYFRQSNFLDLYDLKDNSCGGLHLACIGITWMCLVHGFLGMRDYSDKLVFKPSIPNVWNSIKLVLNWQGNEMLIYVNQVEIKFDLITGNGVEFFLYDEQLKLSKENPSIIKNIK